MAPDWVEKGFHIHIGAVELVLRPDHLGGVMFRGFFSATDPTDVTRAVRHARTVCLPDAAVRAKWVRDAGRAMSYLKDYRGALQTLANGRLLEFRFLILALERLTP